MGFFLGKDSENVRDENSDVIGVAFIRFSRIIEIYDSSRNISNKLKVEIDSNKCMITTKYHDRYV